MVLSFERGKDPKEVLKVGRAEGAFRVRKTYLKVVLFQEDPAGGAPNLGQYFRNDLEQEYEIKASSAYVLATLAIKKDYKTLKSMLKSFLAEVPHYAVAHFTFIFQGEPGEKFPKNWMEREDKKYFWKDVMGLDLALDNKIVDVPEARLLPNSDFQFHLDGEDYPARPAL